MRNPIIWWCASVTIGQVVIVCAILFGIPTIGSGDVEMIFKSALRSFFYEEQAKIQLCSDPYAQVDYSK